MHIRREVFPNPGILCRRIAAGLPVQLLSQLPMPIPFQQHHVTSIREMIPETPSAPISMRVWKDFFLVETVTLDPSA